jgi:hypothetical protein
VRVKLDRQPTERAARELQERYRAAFEERGGRLNVRATIATSFRSRTKSLELLAGVDWDESRIYEHAHAEVVRRPLFARGWEEIQSIEDAASKIEGKIKDWLRNPP